MARVFNHMDILWWLALPLSKLIASMSCKAMHALLPIFGAHGQLELQDNPRARIAGSNVSTFYILIMPKYLLMRIH